MQKVKTKARIMKTKILEKQLEFDFMKTEFELIRESWELERKAFMQYGRYLQQMREFRYG